MGKVIIKALSGEAYCGDEDLIDKSILDGVDCQDNFADYIDEELADKIEDGYMDFKFEDGKLYTYTEYTTKENLTDEELTQLGKYTQGQWSDGIGEGFEQFPCTYLDGEEVYVSPWYFGQVLEITQC